MSKRQKVKQEAARLRRMSRRLGSVDPQAPTPPPLPAGRVVDVSGRGEMFVREAVGRPGGPTILLMHGWTASADLNWFRVYESLAQIGRVIAVDHRGHGRGMRTEEPFTLEAAADDAAALLVHLGAGPAIAVGYSMGGPISMLLWRRHPEVVSGLVLQATALEWRAKRSERALWKLMALVEYSLRLGRPRGLIDRFLREALEVSPDLVPYRGWLRAELRRGDPEMLADAGRALGNYDGRCFAGEVDVPTAVVVTTRDRLVAPRKQRQLAAAIPDARVFELRGDHDACLLLPDQFRAITEVAILSVVERLAERRRSA